MANIRKEKRQERIRERKARRAARRGETLQEEILSEQEQVSAGREEGAAEAEPEVNEPEKEETESVSDFSAGEKEAVKPEAEAAEKDSPETGTEKENEPETETESPESEVTDEGSRKSEETEAGSPETGEERDQNPEAEDLETASTEEKETEAENPEAEIKNPEEEADSPEEEADSPETEMNSPEEEAENPETEEDEKVGFFRRLVRGLTKTRQNIVRGFDSIFSGHSSINDEFYEDLEEVLIMGDVGIHATEEILDRLREKVKENNIKDPADCREYLMNSIKEQMSIGETAYRFEHEKAVILVIGVNGVGKTTTIGKLAGKFKKDGKKVVLAAADTFRAAAAEQLTEWAHRAGVDIVSGQEGSDPGSVVYDACQAARSRNADILLCDTAGRLHNKKNLMAELEKIGRILEKEYPDVYRETLVVLDATTGQNALNQARQFNEVTDITGVVLTKMDGTAKGGIAVAIQSELGIPVKYIGVGETIDDLQKFDSDRFVDALFESGDE